MALFLRKMRKARRQHGELSHTKQRGSSPGISHCRHGNLGKSVKTEGRPYQEEFASCKQRRMPCFLPATATSFGAALSPTCAVEAADGFAHRDWCELAEAPGGGRSPGPSVPSTASRFRSSNRAWARYGVYATFDVYMPELSRLLQIGENAKLRAVLFLATWHLVRSEPQPGDTQRFSASGSGWGLRLAVGNGLSFCLDVSFANLPCGTGNPRLPVSLKQFRMHGVMV